MSKSKIEWTDDTWNPVVGCSKTADPGCANCYAAALAWRWAKSPNDKINEKYGPVVAGPGQWSGACRLTERAIDEPMRWRKPRRVFVCSMGDLFHSHVPDAWIARVWATMAACPRHTFIVLSKRASRLADWTIRWAAGHGGEPLCNVHVGISASTQDWLDTRAPHLCRAAAVCKFVSLEPLLGPMEIRNYLGRVDTQDVALPAPSRGTRYHGVDGVIVGGESGHGARPMHPDWARSLRDQCAEANVPFFFKAWGCWREETSDHWVKYEASVSDLRDIGFLEPDGRFTPTNDLPRHPKEIHCHEWDCWVRHVGKKAAGRLLDGRLHNDLPEVHR